MEALLGYRKASDFQSPSNYGPPSQGIKGDYFDFWPSEMALITKLNALCTSPTRVPSLLPPHKNVSSSNTITSVDDPELFLENLSNDEEFKSFAGLPPTPPRRSEKEPPKKLPFLNGRKNWEGEEIVLCIDPTLDSRERLESSEIGNSSESYKTGRSSLSSDIRSGALSPTPINSTNTTHKRRGRRSPGQKVPSRKVVNFVEDGIFSLSTERLNSPGQRSQASSETASIYLNFTNNLKVVNGDSSQRRKIIKKFLRDKETKQLEDELFMRLAGEREIWDFTEKQNFSLEGDILLRKILRERTRLQMKKDMLGNERDFYLQIHGCSKKEVGKSRAKVDSESIYFAI